MLPLGILWSLSLVLMAGILLYAHVRYNRDFGGVSELPGLRAYLHQEFAIARRAAGDISRRAYVLTRDVVVRAKDPILRGQTLVQERIFGKREVEKGGATSFFLKRISEFKNEKKRQGNETEFE